MLPYWFLLRTVFLLCVALILLLAVRLGYAQHMHPDGPAATWYEPNCCGGKDCHPVADDTVENRKEGVFVSGFGMMSYSDPRLRWSRDDKDHVCASRQYDGSLKLMCLYRRFNGL